MARIKIISNPYKKKVEFYAESVANTWDELKIDNANSKLREVDSDEIFLPFAIKEILEIICKDYAIPGVRKVDVIFEGTQDEYDEVQAVCSDEDFVDLVNLSRSDNYLFDARDILKETKEIFGDVYPILDRIVGDSEQVKKNLDKVADALDDIVPICVFGNYSAGKSTFINALIGNELLPSGGEAVTAKIFKISASSQEDRVAIEFEYCGELFEIRIDNNGYKTIKGSVNNELMQKLDEIIGELEEKDIFIIASKTLDIINSVEREDKNLSILGDVVSIEVPFRKNGILGSSVNKYVIFDTPGSNSNSNKDHAEVLKKAMEGFSNGIPVWVSHYESIDSIDNAKLCEDIYASDALDKRFTMIVVNKADTAELPEGFWSEKDLKRIMELDSIEKMYSGGIYFVSSIMGLGSKNDAKFSNKFMRKTFKEKKSAFEDYEDDEFYQTLYMYNIMPQQIKDNAIAYSLDESNLIYANSGLLCVEKEIETFASKYSAYNKCQMFYKFLADVIDKTNLRIEDRKQVLEGYRETEKEKQGQKETLLKERMQVCIDRCLDEFEKNSKIYIKYYVKENLQYKREISELNEIDSTYSEKNAEEYHLHAYEGNYKYFADTKKQNLRNNIQSLRKGTVKFTDVVKAYVSDSGIVKASKVELDKSRKDVNRSTADTLMGIVRNDYREYMISAKNYIDISLKDYWQKNSEILKKDLALLISETDALSLQERTEISSLILNYENFIFNDNADDIFIKNKYLIRDTERLNIKRLSDSFNTKLSKNVMELAKDRNACCIETFNGWLEQLKVVINQNINEYNPELKEITKKIALLSNEINELEMNQRTTVDSFDTIGNLMAWKCEE